jgi:hypothetical protein
MVPEWLLWTLVVSAIVSVPCIVYTVAAQAHYDATGAEHPGPKTRLGAWAFGIGKVGLLVFLGTMCSLFFW